MDKIKTELLVSLVRKYPLIYDKNDKHHKSIPERKKIWQIIATEFGSSVTSKQVRERWRNLRDAYRAQLNKSQLSAMKGEISEPTWPYYHILDFLREHVQTKMSQVYMNGNNSHHTGYLTDPSICRLDGASNTEFIECDIDIDDDPIFLPDNKIENIEIDDLINSDSEKELITKSEPPEKKRKTEDDTQTPVQNGVPADDGIDDDKCFLDSLLPYMRRISARDKLLCRIKMQEVVHSFAFPR